MFYFKDHTGKFVLYFPEGFAGWFSEKLSTTNSERCSIISSDDKSAEHSSAPTLPFQDIDNSIVIFFCGFVFKKEWSAFFSVFSSISSEDDSFVSVFDVGK